jgi:hypothetical protein
MKTESGNGDGSHGRRTTADSQSGATVEAAGRTTKMIAAAMTSSRASQDTGGRSPT